MSSTRPGVNIPVGPTIPADINLTDIIVSNTAVFKNNIIVPTPTLATDAVNKEYVDNLIEGIYWKAPCRVATTGSNINLTTGGLLIVDGVLLVSGDRVLVKDQTLPVQNGYYTASPVAWSRATDMTVGTAVGGFACMVTEGTANADSPFICTSDSPNDIVGTDSLAFALFSAGIPAGSNTEIQFNNNQVFGASSELTFSGSTLGLGAAGSIGIIQAPTGISSGGGGLNILTGNAGGVNSTGGVLNLITGNGFGSGDGGAINITSGNGNTLSGSGGDITIAAGYGGIVDGRGGGITIITGYGGLSSGSSGELLISTGQPTGPTAAGGGVTITTGGHYRSGICNIESGDAAFPEGIVISAGDAFEGNGAGIMMLSGDADPFGFETGNGGDIDIIAGDGSSAGGTGGDILIQGGIGLTRSGNVTIEASQSAGTDGQIKLIQNGITSLWPTTAGTSGQFLQTNGAGVLTYATATGAASAGIAGTVQTSDGAGAFTDSGVLFTTAAPNHTFSMGTEGGVVTFVTPTSVTDSVAGGGLTFTTGGGGAGSAGGDGGAIIFNTGDGGAGTYGNGGNFEVTTGNGDPVYGDGGNINLTSGNGGTAYGMGGDVNITAGNSGGTGTGSYNVGGAVSIMSGDGLIAGNILIETGESIGANTSSFYGGIYLHTSDTTIAGNEASGIFLTTGSGTAGNNRGGDIQLQTGAGFGAGNGGDFYIATGSGGGTGLDGSIFLQTDNSLNLGSNPGKIGFYGTTAVVQPSSTGNATVGVAGSTATFTETTYTGGVGATAYTVGDIVAALKALGLMAL